MDHGELNIPGRTSGINAALDRHKAQQARDARSAARAESNGLAERRTRAKALVAAMPAERIDAMAKRLRVTPDRARAELMRLAHWEPARLLAAEEAT